MKPPDPLTCAASDCSNSFYAVIPNQKYCSEACGNRQRVRDYRAKHRKGGGGSGGNGGGGGGAPTLFDTITPQGEGPIALTLPDTCYRTLHTDSTHFVDSKPVCSFFCPSLHEPVPTSFGYY